MHPYTSKEELKDEIKKTYTKFIAEFDNIPEEMKDLRAEDVDRTPAENLAYQVGWTMLVLKWEQDERETVWKRKPRPSSSNGISWGNCISGSRIPTPVSPSVNSGTRWTRISREFMR